MDEIRKQKRSKYITALALLICLLAFKKSWPVDHDEDYHFGRQLISDQPPSGPPLPPPEEFAICGRTAKFHEASWPLQQKYHNCPKYNPKRRTLVLKVNDAFGQSGNQLRSFIRAVQYTRDKHLQLGVMHNSWAMKTIGQFFMADNRNTSENGLDWKSQMESSLCIKIFKKRPKKHPLYKSPRQLFYYKSKVSKEKQVASQLHIMRTFFQHYNTGIGHNGTKVVKDMCSGIDSLFANAGDEEGVGIGDREDPRSSTLYSVIHLRSFEGRGRVILAKTAKKTGCDPLATLEMKPGYIKSILAPLGMLAHPIVVISDNQKGSKKVLSRLLSDPDIGPMVRVVPAEARWLGGDMALAVMANVFIGHPSSTMTEFIARSRVALGFGHNSNYIHLARDKSGEWARVYGVQGGKVY